MSFKVRIAIAIFCGVLLVLGIVLCFLARDEGLFVTVLIYGILYVVYIVVLLKKLRAQPKVDKSGKRSPLNRR